MSRKISKSVPEQSKQNEPTTREKVAVRLSVSPDSFLKYREEPGGIIVAITADGRKFKFSKEELPV